MNRLIADIEKEKQAPEVNSSEQTVDAAEPQMRASSNKVKQNFLSVVSGGFLIGDRALSSLPFVLYIAFLGMLYIANGYYAHNRLKDLDALDNTITELRIQYIIAEDKLMYLSKESELNRATNNIGLKEPVVPPSKIIVYNTDKKH
jgi:Bacteriodetes cell division protein (FtsL-like)